MVIAVTFFQSRSAYSITQMACWRIGQPDNLGIGHMANLGRAIHGVLAQADPADQYDRIGRKASQSEKALDIVARLRTAKRRA